ncbi:aldehyde dehydrogenase family protein [Neobacillus cucumis]|uniref:aldehyde dehydrogenase family protein n=1 Tax=Neobacillus cucumis TaxID=1740721 RepID=UPI00285308A9|nr:aldehyde dehydrogenase family protein [Neobacillus cucumis]MDR4949876.1 aldehyde dehydrogenase family protein [Neobacillus cucumis]
MTNAKTLAVYGNYVNGTWKNSTETLPVFDKFTGEEIAKVAIATREEVTEAIDNAYETFQTSKLSPAQRSEILLKVVEIVRKRKEELALTITQETGKVIKEARGEIDRGIQTLIASAEEAKRISGQGIPLSQHEDADKLAFTIRVPVGVIGAITPFNFPFNLVVHKIGPAIAAGNTVVLKPAEKTPITACKLVEIFTEAGLPNGFINVINGWGHTTGQYLLEDERIAMYTFTGSPTVGRLIKNSTGIRKVTLELGNNSPNIVHKDVADLDRAVELCVSRGFFNAGQACISVQRIYVHKHIYDVFVEKAVQFAKSLKVGDPKDPASDVGPVISEKDAVRVEAWLNEARENGAQVFGGEREGAIIRPAVVTNVTKDMKVVCEEVFAPVISILSYEDIEEAFKRANDTKYGLQAGVFTSNLDIAMQASYKLHFGGVIINNVSTYRADVMPYGGVKDSGIGKEGPHAAIQEMTDEKIIVINL